ncbi:MAG: DNA polymerase III subunit gamma/tau C-terminal domain-containing protein [Gammaproteobacteria bacterium]
MMTGTPSTSAVPAAAAPARNTSTAAGAGRAHDLLQAMRKRQGKTDTEPRDVTSDASAQAFVPQNRQRRTEIQREKPELANTPAAKPDISSEKPDVPVAEPDIPTEKPDVPVAELDILTEKPAMSAPVSVRREATVNVQPLDETTVIAAYSEYEQIAATTLTDSVDEVETPAPACADAAMAAARQQASPTSQETEPQEIPARPVSTAIPQSAAQLSTKENVTTVDLADWPSRWSEIVGALSLQGMALQLAKQTVIKEVTGTHLTLALAQSHSGLCTESTETRLREALSQFIGCPLKLTIRIDEVKGDTPAAVDARLKSKRQQAAEHLIQDDPNVQALQATFNASIRAGSVQPLDE